REEIQRILEAAADKEPAEGLARKNNPGRGKRREHKREAGAIEMGLGVAGIDVGQELREREVTDAGTCAPRPVQLLRAHPVTEKCYVVATNSRPRVIAECADHPALRELVVAAELPLHQPAIAAGSLVQDERRAGGGNSHVVIEAIDAVAAADANVAAGPA